MRRICQLGFLLLCFLEGGVWSLRNLSITAPRAVLSGEGQSALLRCSYDLEGAALYSIRWYRDEYEFYRYVPRELPPTMVFPLPGATVDLTRSDDQQVFIVNLNRRLSGVYLCEVSADAPLFHTDIRSAPLTVVDMPFHAPRLTISRGIYERNDVLHANCSVDEAYPAPNITWVLDNQKIAEMVSKQTLDLDFKERAAFSQLEINIREINSYNTEAIFGNGYHESAYTSQPDHYQIGDMSYVERLSMFPPQSGQFTINCIASIYDVYERTSELRYIKEDNPRPASVTGKHSSGVTTVCNLFFICICVCTSILGRML
ncbi:unnamed protein product [Parnassius apollo]|uniref:(apollo) hypothetical protein n=1 Tax=Parnassius apollo TaxID=110799 RepID=A0A8S3WJM6_PARAO|nr:unnamed protein product [Parnassius apollo]